MAPPVTAIISVITNSKTIEGQTASAIRHQMLDWIFLFFPTPTHWRPGCRAFGRFACPSLPFAASDRIYSKSIHMRTFKVEFVFVVGFSFFDFCFMLPFMLANTQ